MINQFPRLGIHDQLFLRAISSQPKSVRQIYSMVLKIYEGIKNVEERELFKTAKSLLEKELIIKEGSIYKLSEQGKEIIDIIKEIESRKEKILC